jgi:PPM family protein phosphatase
MAGDSESDTVEDLRLSGAAARPSRVVFGVEVGGLTHTGKVRPNNEDHFHIVQFGRFLRTLVSSLPAGEVPEEVGEPGYGFAVADGIGGHAAGEVASRTAISLLVECVLQTPDWILGHEDHLLTRVMDRFADRFQTINFALQARSDSEPAFRGMGTTLSVAISLGEDLLVTHVGDSAAFLCRRGQLHRLTRDHTTSQLRPDPDAANGARFRRVLTRAIGLHQTGGEPDLYHYRLADGDRLLLCTDGLTDMVGEHTIANELDRASSASSACQTLVDLALDRGGRDNVTAVVATYRLPGAAGSDRAV